MNQVMGEENASVVYHLLHGSNQSPLPFILESNGSLVLVHELDYEMNSSYPIEVSAWTETNENVVHSFTVQVADVYEEAFDFNASELIISEHAPIGTVIGQMNQVMGEENASVVYYLLHGASQSPSPFILESNGSLVLVHELDYETNSSYPIEVSAWTETNENVVHSFTVQVEDVYEEIPFTPLLDPFEFNATVLQVPEDAPIGRDVGSVYRVSGDMNQSVVFSMEQNGSAPIPFSVESNGAVLVAGALDYEQNASYSIHIRGTEGNRSVVHHYVINILDVNESVLPQLDPFDFNATALQVDENAPIGSHVGSVYRVSGDLNQSVTFELEHNGTNTPPFSVEGNGTIWVAGDLDYEQNSSYSIHIRGTEGNRTFVHHYRVEVRDIFEMDINSAPTDISLLSQNLEIKGNLEAGTLVGSLMVIDSDVDDNHTFYLVEGSGGFDNSLFVMELNGSLRTSMVLDLGSDQNLSIRTQAIDLRGATYEKVFQISYHHQQAGEDASLLSDGAEVAPGWKRAGWFGFYFADFYPWVYHENLGWIYVSEKTMDGAWFFRERLGWIWTSPEIFPALFQYEKSQWTYLDTSNPLTILFDYDRMEWFFLDRDYEITGLSNPAAGGYVKGLGIYERGQMAQIEAVPTSGYLFVEWKGDSTKLSPLLTIEVYDDFKLEAVFKPIVSANAPPEEAIGNALEAINSIEGLSPELKQKALAELLLTGQSSTAGIKGTGN